ncbi:NAD(P)-binding protein [Trametes sanguinea]|nr:NAD(P)-binding protein [Trametes sanguinea]
MAFSIPPLSTLWLQTGVQCCTVHHTFGAQQVAVIRRRQFQGLAAHNTSVVMTFSNWVRACSSENVIVVACHNPDKATVPNGLSTSAPCTSAKWISMTLTASRCSVKQLKPIVGEMGSDYLINNAGIEPRDFAFSVDPDVHLQTTRTIVAGPATVSAVCLPFLEMSNRKVVLHMSSIGGSIGSVERLGGREASYSTSKAALNILAAKKKAERPDLTAIRMCPGWIKSEESIAGILKVITPVTNADSGSLLRLMASATRPTTWLVTGTSRGIGLELVRQLVASPENLVVAACRNPDKATALQSLRDSAKGMLHIIQLDVSDFDSIRASVKHLQPILGETGLDYLVNNAGIPSRDTAFTLDPEKLLQVFRTNAAGPAVVSQVCLPFVEKGSRKVILHISSTLGSSQSVNWTIGGSYSMSKAALNMLTLKQKAERPDITFITMCPGWVRTELGGKDADLDPEESVTGILKVITSVTNADSGRYLRYNGEEIPW